MESRETNSTEPIRTWRLAFMGGLYTTEGNYDIIGYMDHSSSNFIYIYQGLLYNKQFLGVRSKSHINAV